MRTALDLPPSSDEYRRLVSTYAEPQRAYYTLQHLAECLEKLDWVRSEGEFPAPGPGRDGPLVPRRSLPAAAAPQIYSTGLFYEHYEERARANLERSIAALR